MPSLEASLPAPPALDEDTIDDILYSARAGELQSLKADVATAANSYSASVASVLLAAIDEVTGNSCVHYAAANGHLEILDYATTTITPPSLLLAKQNLAGNTPLHYAALNGHLPAVKLIIGCVSSETKADLVACKNLAGHDAAFEAEGNGKDDVVNFLLSVLDEADGKATEGDPSDPDESLDASVENGQINSDQVVDEAGESVRQMKVQDD